MNNWISVKDRLPGVGTEFLGYCDGDIDHYQMAEDCIWNRNSSNQAREDIFDFVTYCMPTKDLVAELKDDDTEVS